MDDKQTNNSAQPQDPGVTLPSLQQADQPDEQQLSVPPPMPMPAGQTVPDSRALIPTPDVAGDNDLIEKEWVLKAKQIVEHTAEDPFSQQEELSKMKADYLKKRYNKDMGTSS